LRGTYTFKGGEGREQEKRGEEREKKGSGGGGSSGDVVEEAFCLKSAHEQSACSPLQVCSATF